MFLCLKETLHIHVLHFHSFEKLIPIAKGNNCFYSRILTQMAHFISGMVPKICPKGRQFNIFLINLSPILYSFLNW